MSVYFDHITGLKTLVGSSMKNYIKKHELMDVISTRSPDNTKAVAIKLASDGSRTVVFGLEVPI